MRVGCASKLLPPLHPRPHPHRSSSTGGREPEKIKSIEKVKPSLTAAALLFLAALSAGPAVAQSAEPESSTGPYDDGRLGYAFQHNDKNETVHFDTDLDSSFDNTVTTGTGADA